MVTCYDGLERRFYPRILTYSADYPEKVLLASIKNLGTFPCPRCTVVMKDVPAMGKKRDRANRTRLVRIDNQDKQTRVSKARSLIYNDHHPVTSSLIEGHLAYGSLIPTNVRPLSLVCAMLIKPRRTPFLKGCLAMVLTFIGCWWSMSCMRWRSDRGKQCLSSCYASCRRWIRAQSISLMHGELALIYHLISGN